MGGAVPPLPQYAFMAWCSGGAQVFVDLLEIILTETLFISVERSI
jgi:hypothetical protein